MTEIKTLSNNYVAIINNCNKKISYSLEDAEYINNLLYKCKILVFKNLNFDYEEFESFARQFGELESAHPKQYQVKNHPSIRIQSNTQKEGIDYIGLYWHSDGSWQEEPTKATLLSCIEAPTKGGETLFSNMAQAYQDLPTQIKEKIGLLKGLYPSKEIYLEEMQEMKLEVGKEILEKLKDVLHPLVRQHSVTGEKALYLSEHVLKYVEGISEEESNNLLDYLYKHCTHEKYLYQHTWEKNDLLIWDNSSVIHKGLRPNPEFPKTTMRITIKGTV